MSLSKLSKTWFKKRSGKRHAPEEEAITPEPPCTSGCTEPTLLVEQHIRWLHSTHFGKPNEEMAARVRRLNDLISNWKERLDAKDLRKTLSEEEMTGLLNDLSETFFDAELVPPQPSFQVQFDWVDDHDKNKWNILGVTIHKSYGCLIKLDPNVVNPLNHWVFPKVFDKRRQGRLGTLVHELCHAFFCRHICENCQSRVSHGMAWQQLALELEHVSSNLLGLRMDLDRCLSLTCDEEKLGIKSRGRLDWDEFNLADTVVGRMAFKKPYLLHPKTVKMCRVIRSRSVLE